MELQPDRGSVLILADDERSGHGLCGWVDDAGEQSVFLNVDEARLLRSGTDETFDLVVTDLDAGQTDQREILERLAGGELFFGIPQLHLLRDPALSSELIGVNPDVASSSISAPPDRNEFKSRVELATEVGRLRREIANSAVTDPLSGSFNRRFVLMRLEQEFSRARRHGTSLSLLLFEIDGLREINARHGVHVGDRVIRHVGRVIGEHVRSEDVCGRWGEKTFATVLAGTTFRGAAVFGNKVRDAAESVRVPLEDGELEVRLSAGISTYRDNATQGPSELLQSAEKALDQARRRGGNRVHIDEASLSGARRLILIADNDPDLVDLADDLLSMHDFRVVRAESVPALLEILTERRPDLLVLGLSMLKRQGGPAMIQTMRNTYPAWHLPIVGLSDTAGLRWDRLTHLGLDRFITKPFSVSLLVDLAHDLAFRRPPSRVPVAAV